MGFSEQVVFADNSMSNCGDDHCVEAFESTDMQVVDNWFTAAGPDLTRFAVTLSLAGSNVISGNHVQGMFARGIAIRGPFPGDGAPPADINIERNDIRIAGGDLGTGIRMVRFSDSLIANNHVDFMTDSPFTAGIEIRGEVGEFQVYEGGELVFENALFSPARNNIVRNNRVGGAETGLVVDAACVNRFFGNNLQLNQNGAVIGLAGEATFDEPPFLFYQRQGGTGANRYVGNATIVAEAVLGFGTIAGDGYLDCDGDGVSDPNSYSGQTPN